MLAGRFYFSIRVREIGVPWRRFVRGACGNAGTWNTSSANHARISNAMNVLSPREPA
jgi:hypothetical protein